jgi:hypothetical protein
MPIVSGNVNTFLQLFLVLAPQVPLDEFAHPRRFPLKLRDEQVSKLLTRLVLAQAWQCAA